MKKLNYLTIVLLMLIINSCQPDEPPPIVEDTDRRTQFVGTYKVIDANPNYYFTINKLDTLGQTWLSIKNFANLFDFKYRSLKNLDPSNRLDFQSFFPIIDHKFKHQWSFKVYGNDTIRNTSLLVNDTLRVYYRIHNTPWYGEDDTTYIDKYILKTAVKQK